MKLEELDQDVIDKALLVYYKYANPNHEEKSRLDQKLCDLLGYDGKITNENLKRDIQDILKKYYLSNNSHVSDESYHPITLDEVERSFFAGHMYQVRLGSEDGQTLGIVISVDEKRRVLFDVDTKSNVITKEKQDIKEMWELYGIPITLVN